MFGGKVLVTDSQDTHNTLDTAAIDAAAKADSLTFLNKAGNAAREIGTAITAAAREVAAMGTELLEADAALIAAGAVVENVTHRWAEAIIRFRLRFTLADGLPDWNGSSQAYKLTVGYIAAAATVDPSDDMAVLRTRNRLQKAVSRMLPAFVVTHLVKTGAVTASDADQAEALRLFDKGQRTTKNDDVNAVLQALRTQLRSDSASGNKTGGKGGSRNTPAADAETDASNVEALANKSAAEAFPVAVEAETVGLTEAIGAVRLAMLSLWDRLGRAELHFGDGGREAFLANAADVTLLSTCIGKRAGGIAIPTAELALMVKRFGPQPEPQPEPQRKRSGGKRKRSGGKRKQPVAA